MSESDELIMNALRYSALYCTTLEEMLAKYAGLCSLTVGLEKLTYNVHVELRRDVLCHTILPRLPKSFFTAWALGEWSVVGVELQRRCQFALNFRSQLAAVCSV